MAKKLVIGGINITEADDDYGYPFQNPVNDPETDYFYYINSYIEIEDGSVNLKDSASGFSTILKQPITPTEEHQIRLPDGADDAAGASVMSDGSGNWVYDFAGDVAGPISSTNHAVPRFVGTDGQVLGNTAAIIDDSNNFEIPGNITSTSGNLYGSAVSTTTGSITGALAVGSLTSSGIVRSNGDGGGDTHFDGYILAADTQPAVRITSYPTARMELGPGGSTAADVTFLRTGANAAALALGGSNQITFSTSAIAMTPTLEVGQNGIKFYEDVANGSHSVKLVSNASLAGDLVFYLPIADGTSGQVMRTNGAGQLSFATVSGGSGLPSFDSIDDLLLEAEPIDGYLSYVKGLGLLRWYDTQHEPFDGENVFNTSTGQWVVEIYGPEYAYYLFSTIVGNNGVPGQYLQTNGNGSFSWSTITIPDSLTVIDEEVSTSSVATITFSGLSAYTIEFELVATVDAAATGEAFCFLRVNGLATGVYSCGGYYEDNSLNAWTRHPPVSAQTSGVIMRLDDGSNNGQQLHATGTITVFPNGTMIYRCNYSSFYDFEAGFFYGFGNGFGSSGITSLTFFGSEFNFDNNDYIKLWKRR